jgi:hypothetical protein
LSIEDVFEMKRFYRNNGTHIVLCPGKRQNTVDNYVVLNVRKAGFVVIKQKILIGE